jgi:DNA mismatch repair protein MutS
MLLPSTEFSVSKPTKDHDNNEPRPRQAKSLLEVLNVTCSRMGARLLRDWLLHPLTDRNEILRRQQSIEDFMVHPDKLTLLRSGREYLRGFPDLERLGKITFTI